MIVRDYEGLEEPVVNTKQYPKAWQHVFNVLCVHTSSRWSMGLMAQSESPKYYRVSVLVCGSDHAACCTMDVLVPPLELFLSHGSAEADADVLGVYQRGFAANAL